MDAYDGLMVRAYRIVDDMDTARARVHALSVGLKLPLGKLQLAGLMHDVVEDCYMTLAEVQSAFGEEVARIVEVLTRKQGEMYFDYIKRVALDPDAIQVKLADLEHNLSDLSETHPLRQRYQKAMGILLDALVPK